ncbi:MAG: hypothetical protein HY806_04890 [Nitrospirae bacterium]|nr:hypothetical protein [Nitrospirota bacterium]
MNREPLIKKFENIFWLILISASHLGFSYYFFNGWWYSAIGSILIIFFSYMLWRERFAVILGLKISKEAIKFSMALLTASFLGSYFIMNAAATKSLVKIQVIAYQNFIHDLFYTLNEEMVLGAILLGITARKTRISPVYISIGTAVVFSALHFIFYKWVFDIKGIIQPTALITLFFAGVMRNNLIIAVKHIGYAWALHFSWIAVMLGTDHFFTETGIRLSEPDRFNLYLGSGGMLIISIILAVFSVWFYKRKTQTV